MSCFNIYRMPEKVLVQTEEEWVELKCDGGEIWNWHSIQITTEINDSGVQIYLISPAVPVKRIKLRWRQDISKEMLFLNDHWERGYGDLEWRGMVPERVFPWYFMAHDREITSGYGVKTGTGSICSWQVDTSGVSLYLDVRSGGMGVNLGERELKAAVIVMRKGTPDETPFQAAQAFCRLMCGQPKMPAHPVYGGNNWYYAYGRSSHLQIVEDSRLIASLSPSSDNRPYMVIDDGWQICHGKSCNGGPWHQGNFSFPDMQRLAEDMEKVGTRPGIWIRPLLTCEKIPDSWVLPKKHEGFNYDGQIMDPSVPDVLDKIGKDISRIVEWGYKLVKHDFTTFDIMGKWGFQMRSTVTDEGWAFYDRTKTTAEIVLGLYNAIRRAASDAIVIGCNTIGHLGAGIFELQRTGDDTSGREWERTRKYGINTLAFRMPQHGTFFAADADCVGLTNEVPWDFNKQWLDLLSKSGTPLFVSALPAAVGKAQEKAIKLAFENASRPMPGGEPLDWMETTCPRKWSLNGEVIHFDWFGDEGIKLF